MAIEYLSDILLPRDPQAALHAATKQYVDATVASAASLSGTTPTAVAATDAVGTGTTAARSDHVHNYSFSATAPAAVNTAAAVGSATLPARGDHVHAYTFYAAAPSALGTAAVGSATLPARGDHVHPLPTAAAIGAAATSHTHTASQVTDLGTAATCNTGTGSGQIPVLDASGKLPASVITDVNIANTFPVASQTAMLALLTAQVGDIAIRTDESKTYILMQTPAATLANWVLLMTPTSGVSSVNTRTGAVTLTKSDVGLANVDNTSDVNKPVSTAQQTAINALMTSTAPSPVNTVAAVGSATTLARADHVHAYTFYGTAPAALGTAAVGSATLPARGDHVHPVPQGAQFYRGTVTHGLNTQEVTVSVFKNTLPPTPVMVQWIPTTANTVTLSFAIAPAASDTYIVKVRA